MAILRENFFHKNYFSKIGPEKSIDLIQEIEKSINFLEETNSNPRAILENIFIKL